MVIEIDKQALLVHVAVLFACGFIGVTLEFVGHLMKFQEQLGFVNRNRIRAYQRHVFANDMRIFMMNSMYSIGALYVLGAFLYHGCSFIVNSN